MNQPDTQVPSKTLVALLRAIQLDTCDRAADEIERLQRELAERPALLDGLSVQQWKEHAKAGWKLYAARAENEPPVALVTEMREWLHVLRQGDDLTLRGEQMLKQTIARADEYLRSTPTKEEERTADPDPWCDDCRAWQCHCEHNTRETK